MKSSPDLITLFFDYDGTLHDCIRIYAPAFRQVYQELLRDGLVSSRRFSDEEISRWLGLSVKEMWDAFMPKLDQRRRDYYAGRIGEEMLHMIQAGGAALYPGTEDTLRTLRERGYRLVFISNCLHSYMEAHRRSFHLDRYFSDYLCAEDFPNLAKWEIYQATRDRFPGQHIIIGDRQKDMEIAQMFSLPSVGCAYGYGTPKELAHCTLLISDITELQTKLTKMVRI